MDIQIAAAGLLILRIFSTLLIARVLATQFPLLGQPDSLRTVRTRYFLLALSVSLLLANLVPVIVDLETIFNSLERSTESLNPIGTLYAFSNAVFSVLSSLIVWGMYKFIELDDKDL